MIVGRYKVMLKKLGQNIIKYIVMACGIIFLATLLLPGILGVYKPFALLFKIGTGLTIMVAVLAFFAFLKAAIKSKKPHIAKNEEATENAKTTGVAKTSTTTENAKRTFILHDLPPETAQSLFSHLTNVKLFCAARQMATCKGFYDCWLKEPGVCALHDGVQNLGTEIAKYDTFIIVSKSLYGGFGREIKNALDRSVSFALPFFLIRNKELHHQIRYDIPGTMQVYIYDADTLSEMEKSSIHGVVTAVGVNLDKQNCETIFINDALELREVLT